MRRRFSICDWRLSNGRAAFRFVAIAAALPWWAGPTLQTVQAQTGGDYVICKNTIDGGGETFHTGGTYRLGGTVGQHDAGPLAGGDYVLNGGFWTPGSMMVDLPPTPIADPTGIDKTRFISFSVAGGPTPALAIRVLLVSLHHVEPPYTGGPTVPFTAFEGQERWVGPHFYVGCEAIPLDCFRAAYLQCSPFYQDWTTVGLLHVTGSAIVPSSIYRVELLSAACQGVESSPACLSGGSLVTQQLQIRTTRWGDVETPYNPPDPTTQPDLADVSALVNKFRGLPGAPIKPRALLVGDDAFGVISPGTMNVDFSFQHISACVDAFRGKPYPHAIESCP